MRPSCRRCKAIMPVAGKVWKSASIPIAAIGERPGGEPMKLATLANGTRDGRLVVVSRSLAHATDARDIAPALQDALDDWTRLAPRLEMLAAALETGAVPCERFREHDALSPLPRAFQWIDGSAYLSHVELVRKARGAAMPPDLWT